jgi:hypothetical protein
MTPNLYTLFNVAPPRAAQPVQLELPLRRRPMSEAERDERDTDKMLEALARVKARREARSNPLNNPASDKYMIENAERVLRELDSPPTFGSFDGEPFVWTPREAWVLSDGSWRAVNSAVVGMNGRVLSRPHSRPSFPRCRRCRYSPDRMAVPCLHERDRANSRQARGGLRAALLLPIIALPGSEIAPPLALHYDGARSAATAAYWGKPATLVCGRQGRS